MTPGGSSTIQMNTLTVHRTIQLTTLAGRVFEIRTQRGQTKITMNQLRKNYRLTRKNVGRAPSLGIVPWHLPKN